MLRGGVIGLGRMGIAHYAILNPHPDVEFRAAADSSKFMLKTFERYSPLELYDDYKKMLKKSELDFVIVSTPTASHYEIVRDAIERGLHVFVEKPFALTMEQGRELVAAAAKAGVVNQVGYFLRFNCMFREVRSYLQAGLIGDVVHYKNEMYGKTVLKPSKTSWRSKKQMGGGCMLDFASHCIDLSLHLFGPVARVGGTRLPSIYSANVEDAVYTTLSHENGVGGNVLVNWSDASYRRPYNRIEVTGTQGRIIADRQEVRLFLREARDGHEKGWSVKYLPELEHSVRISVRGVEFTEQLDHFVDHVKRGDAETICPFSHGLQCDHVIERIRADAAGRCRVMDRVILGDNQFFGVNHMSEERGMERMRRFQETSAIIDTLDVAYDVGVRAFSFSTHDRVRDICDHFRAHPAKYEGVSFYPGLPYAHKYAELVNEKGVLGAIKEVLTEGNAASNLVSMLARGGAFALKQDPKEMMKMLVDAEMRMFRDLDVKVIFLQNIVTDLLQGVGWSQVFVDYVEYVEQRYGCRAGFMTLNMPSLVRLLHDAGIEDPVVCSAINKVGFQMHPGVEAYEETLRTKKVTAFAMSIMAAGAIPPTEAIEYVAGLPNVTSVMFGASSRRNIQQTKEILEQSVR